MNICKLCDSSVSTHGMEKLLEPWTTRLSFAGFILFLSFEYEIMFSWIPSAPAMFLSILQTCLFFIFTINDA